MSRPAAARANPLRRFLREEEGLIMTEFLIVLPLLIWMFIAMVVFWDTYRTINEAQKASYAVADAISRETEVSRPYLAGMQSVMELLLGRPGVVSMRITSVRWVARNQRYEVIFSESPGNRKPPLSAAQVLALRDRIPLLDDGDTTVILETWTRHIPALNIGLKGMDFENFITTRPRQSHRTCLKETLATTCT
ncbi:TadE/TadG family type IV pilus assembly protein [Pseudogemmobacter faecipullorum]|uniref:Pilus assembly protein n=1 Tax=Pseudogemmobacter faecipullorum TaxID=2755041 RepID=A0ABS8CKH8_9RHOB|nr:hypothetical protein [Pseudogemmobacter faecipullorum]MCB5409896.1 hypothetical protein [Pseudogemmobacter faecipullorum]